MWEQLVAEDSHLAKYMSGKFNFPLNDKVGEILDGKMAVGNHALASNQIGKDEEKNGDGNVSSGANISSDHIDVSDGDDDGNNDKDNGQQNHADTTTGAGAAVASNRNKLCSKRKAVLDSDTDLEERLNIAAAKKRAQRKQYAKQNEYFASAVNSLSELTAAYKINSAPSQRAGGYTNADEQKESAVFDKLQSYCDRNDVSGADKVALQVLFADNHQYWGPWLRQIQAEEIMFITNISPK